MESPIHISKNISLRHQIREMNFNDLSLFKEFIETKLNIGFDDEFMGEKLTVLLDYINKDLKTLQ